MKKIILLVLFIGSLLHSGLGQPDVVGAKHAKEERSPAYDECFVVTYQLVFFTFG